MEMRSTRGSFLTAIAGPGRAAACLYLGAMVILYSYLYGFSGVKRVNSQLENKRASALTTAGC